MTRSPLEGETAAAAAGVRDDVHTVDVAGGELVASIYSGPLSQLRVVLFFDDHGRAKLDVRAWRARGRSLTPTPRGLIVLGPEVSELAAALARASEIIQQRANERKRP